MITQKLNSVGTYVKTRRRVIFFPIPNKRSLGVLKEEFFGFLDGESENETLRKLRNSGGYLDIVVTDGVYAIIPNNGKRLR